MGLFDSDIRRRLSSLEIHLEKQDHAQVQTQVVEAELSTQVKSMAESLKEYVAKEEVFMRDHTRREEVAAKEHLDILNDIKLTIQGVRNTQDNQPKDVALMLVEHKIKIDEEVDKKLEEFTPLAEFTSSTAYIKKHIKYIWIMVAVGLISYFGNDKLLQFLSHL